MISLFFSQNLKCQGIIEAMQELEAKAALLDVNQLDTIETRLGTLIYRMDSIAQKKATTEQESEQEQKVKYRSAKINITMSCTINLFFSNRSQKCMK